SQWTPQILDLLAEAGAKATFFVCGWALAPNVAALQRIYAEGHEIGNHSYWHPHLTNLEDGEILYEIGATSGELHELLGVRPTLWRAPHFNHNERTDRIAAGLGMTHVGFTCDPGDWNAPDANWIADYVIGGLCDGAIVDLHDGIPPNGGTGTRTRQ